MPSQEASCPLSRKQTQHSFPHWWQAHWALWRFCLTAQHRNFMWRSKSCYTVLEDYLKDTAKVELLVLGLVGKYLSGPWMKWFYTSADHQINHVDGIKVVQDMIAAIKEASIHPENLISSAVPTSHMRKPKTVSRLEDFSQESTRSYKQRYMRWEEPHCPRHWTLPSDWKMQVNSSLPSVDATKASATYYTE